MISMDSGTSVPMVSQTVNNPLDHIATSCTRSAKRGQRLSGSGATGRDHPPTFGRASPTPGNAAQRERANECGPVPDDDLAPREGRYVRSASGAEHAPADHRPVRQSISRRHRAERRVRQGDSDQERHRHRPVHLFKARDQGDAEGNLPFAVPAHAGGGS